MIYVCKKKCYWGLKLWKVGEVFKSKDGSKEEPPIEWFESNKVAKKEEPKEVTPEVISEANEPVKVATRSSRKKK